MFLPIGDTPNPANFRPWMTWLLIALNVAVYLAISVPLTSEPVNPASPAVQEYLRVILSRGDFSGSIQQLLTSLTSYDLYVFEHGFKPGAPGLDDLFYSLFLHGGVLHLAGNMLFLWIYGDNVEHRLGRIGFLLVYLATGVAATLFFSVFALDSLVPLVGASGAISGVLGLYFLLFPRNRIKVFIALIPFFFNVVLIPARWVLTIYLVLDNLLPFLLGVSSGVAHGAHIGGFFAGFALAWIGERSLWRWPWNRQRLGRRPALASPGDTVASLREAIAKNEERDAIELLFHTDRKELFLLSPTECARLANWLEQAGFSAAAVELLRGCIARNARAPDIARAFLALGMVRLHQGQPTTAYQHLLTALESRPDRETAEQAERALLRIGPFRTRG